MAKKKKRRSTGSRARERAKNRKNTGGGSYLKDVDHEFTPKKGMNMIDVVPYEIKVDNNPDSEEGEIDSSRTIYVHYGIGAEEAKYICPKTIGKKCPVCEVMRELYKEGDKDGGNAIRPKERELRNVWNHEEDRAELWDISWWNFGKLLDEEIVADEDEDDVYGDFADLENGFTIKARMKEDKYNNNPYFTASKIDFKKRADFPESILDEVYDLDEILIVPSYEELQKAFLEVDEDEEEEDNGRSSKKDSKSSKSSRRRRSDDDDDDADDDDDIDDDDDDIDDLEEFDDDSDDDDDDYDDDDDDSDDEEEDELDDESDDDESDDEPEDDESEDDDEVDVDAAPRRRTRTKSTQKRNSKSARSSRGGGGGTKTKSKKSVKKKAPEKKPTRRRRSR